jgi:hypothetical protein
MPSQSQGNTPIIATPVSAGPQPVGATAVSGQEGAEQAMPEGRGLASGVEPSHDIRSIRTTEGKKMPAPEVNETIAQQVSQSLGQALTPEVAALFAGTAPADLARQLITPVVDTSAPVSAPPLVDTDKALFLALHLTTIVERLAVPDRPVTIADINRSISAYNLLIAVMELKDPVQMDSFPHLNSIGAVLAALRSSAS